MHQPGITKAVVNLATEMVYLEFDPTQWNHESLVSAVERAEARAYR